MPKQPPAADLDGVSRLRAVMAALRDPDGGCPWDLKQDFSTIAPYTIEEAYEVADAIQRGALHDLKDELGDLLLQVVFHSRMAEEQDAFRSNAMATNAKKVLGKPNKGHEAKKGHAQNRKDAHEQ